jgi:hypothetical protein
MIKTPIAIAKMAMRIPSPEKMRPSSCISPPMMSQIPNKSMLRFLGSLGRFIERLLSVNELRVFSGSFDNAPPKHYPSPKQ